MEATTIWKFLHIAFIFVAVSIFVGQGIGAVVAVVFAYVIATSRRAREIGLPTG